MAMHPNQRVEVICTLDSGLNIPVLNRDPRRHSIGDRADIDIRGDSTLGGKLLGRVLVPFDDQIVQDQTIQITFPTQGSSATSRQSQPRLFTQNQKDTSNTHFGRK